jgi:aminoglycoside phosphotransferase (APT) family kinase protein
MSPTDTAPVLLDTLRGALGRSGIDFDGAPVALTGGFHAELLRFRLLDPPPELTGELVARILPDPAHGMWEAVVQRHVAELGFPTPAVRLAVPPPSPLDRYLMVMDHVAGRPPLSDPGLRSVLGQLPRMMTELPDLLASMAARLHALDPEPLAAELRSLGSGRPLDAAEFVRHLVDGAVALDRHDLAGIGRRLLQREPQDQPRVITHGDLHPLNLLVTEDGDAVLVDWTVAAIAPAGFTLGFTELVLANPPLPAPGPVRTGLSVLGRRVARRFLSTYRRLSGEEVDERSLEWFRQVHALRILVESAAWDVPPAHHPWLALQPVATRLLAAV